MAMDKNEIVAAYMDKVKVYAVAVGTGHRVSGEITAIDSSDDTAYVDGWWCRWSDISTEPPTPYPSVPRVVVAAASFIELIRANCPRVRLTGDDFTDEGKEAEAYLLGLLAKADNTCPGAVYIACIDPDGLVLVSTTEGNEGESFEFID